MTQKRLNSYSLFLVGNVAFQLELLPVTALSQNMPKKILILTDDSCRKCKMLDTIESIDHIMCHCPDLSRTRPRYLGKHFFVNLEEVAATHLSSIKAYAKAINIFPSTISQAFRPSSLKPPWLEFCGYTKDYISLCEAYLPPL